MGSVDADAHVYETEVTWSFIEEKYKKFTPQVTTRTGGAERVGDDGEQMQYWLVDNRWHPKNNNLMPGTTVEQREMRNISARLAHMDELGVDVQVIYTSLFLRPAVRTPEAELALTRAYNRWIGSVCAEAPDRLHWAMVPAIQSMDKNREEVEWAKAHGASAIMLRGTEWERHLCDPYFFPLYELAGEFGLPICIHSGNGSISQHDFCLEDSSFTKFFQPCVGAFHSLVFKNIPGKFPNVRWGFVELGAQWLPQVYMDLKRRLPRFGRRVSENFLGDNNMFVAANIYDDISYITQFVGEDNLVIGTDYGHNDQSSRVDAFEVFRNRNDIDPAVIKKITDENPRRLYGL
ncbi:MAG: amidohydrolase family protein [Alphaproteobacteria bacterium]|nr:amidohydrolase family protein [Alphaproteobacteria bacterium]